MRELLGTYDAWQRDGLAMGRAMLVRTFSSAPRPMGSTLLVSEDGRLAGSVSGGCVEGDVARHIEAARADGRQRVIRYGISDEQAWGVGLACGGTIDVLVQPAVPRAAVEAARAVQRDRSGGRALVTTLPAGSPGASIGPSQVGPDGEPGDPIVVHEADARLHGSLGDPSSDALLRDAALAALERGVSGPLELAGRQLFIEVYPVRPRLVIIGGVPVAMVLIRLARELGYETVVVDARPAFATTERFPDVDRLIVAWPDEAADDIRLGPADAVAVLSHDPKLDEPAIVAALDRGCRYVGAIGSRRTQQRRRERLVELGVDAAALERLRGPVGLDLGGQESAEIALAIMAEIVAAQHGGSARPMREVARAGPVLPALQA